MKIIFQNIPDWFNWLSLIIIPILCAIITTIVNVKMVNKNTNKQVENQNKETYKPRLKLNGFQNCERDHNRPEYMFFCGKYELSKTYNVFSKIILENIGNGIANDISFYSLNTGERIILGRSSEKNIIQTGFSTEEIAKSQLYDFQFCFCFRESNINNLNSFNYLPCIIICNYKDLNNNNYKLLMGYLFKNKLESAEKYKDCSFDWYYYQENTFHYNDMITKYEVEYKKILESIKKDSN